MVTKMVANTWPRANIERDATGRAADFHNTNQCLSAQNETGRDDREQILSQARITADSLAAISSELSSAEDVGDVGLVHQS